MRLRQIEVFNAVMEAGTITAAGVNLGVSQYTITKVLQYLEIQTGLRLFHRQGSRLQPTPEARRLFVDTSRAAAQVRVVRRVAAALPHAKRGMVRAVATPSVAAALLAPAVSQWRARDPEAHCEILSHHTAEMVSRVLLGESDFGLSLQNPGRDGIHARCLAEHHMVLAAAPGTWTAEQCAQAMPIERLETCWIGIAADDPLGALVQAYMDSHDRRPTYHTIVHTHQLAGALAQDGHGMVLIDPFTASALQLQTRSCSPAIPVGLWLLTREGSALPAPAQRLVEAIADAARHVCH